MGKTYEVLEKQDRKIKSDLAEKLTAETKTLPEPGISFPREVPYQLHEANLQLKKKILSASPDVKSIVFSSAKHGEGTSTISAYFALSLNKEGDSRILAIDANLRNPVFHKVFGVQNGKGLAELLTNEMDINSAIQATSYRNLLVMSAGRCTQNPAHKFENKRLKGIIGELKAEFDFLHVFYVIGKLSSAAFCIRWIDFRRGVRRLDQLAQLMGEPENLLKQLGVRLPLS